MQIEYVFVYKQIYDIKPATKIIGFKIIGGWVLGQVGKQKHILFAIKLLLIFI